SQRFAYAVVPVDCSGGDIDQLTRVASHEIVEAAVDPIEPTGWFDDSKSVWGGLEHLFEFDGEVGDLCSPGDSKMSDGTWVSTYWSDSAAACFPESDSIVISNEDDRAIQNLWITADFTINGDPHTDYEFVASFDQSIDLGLNAQGGSWNGSAWVGDFLFT